MAIATDQQVQAYSDGILRPFAEKVSEIQELAESIRENIGDVYAACNQQSPTWEDARADGVPNLLTPSDILALNTMAETIRLLDQNAQWAIVQKARVRV